MPRQSQSRHSGHHSRASQATVHSPTGMVPPVRSDETSVFEKRHAPQRKLYYRIMSGIRALSRLAVLFPLNRAGRFGGHVIDDAVDAFDFVDDARGDATEEIMLERVIVRGHTIC